MSAFLDCLIVVVHHRQQPKIVEISRFRNFLISENNQSTSYDTSVYTLFVQQLHTYDITPVSCSQSFEIVHVLRIIVYNRPGRMPFERISTCITAVSTF